MSHRYWGALHLPALMIEAWVTLPLPPPLLQLPDEVSHRYWGALHLPALIEARVAHLDENMRREEAALMLRLSDSRAGLQERIDELAQEIRVRAGTLELPAWPRVASNDCVDKKCVDERVNCSPSLLPPA